MESLERAVFLECSSEPRAWRLKQHEAQSCQRHLQSCDAKPGHSEGLSGREGEGWGDQGPRCAGEGTVVGRAGSGEILSGDPQSTQPFPRWMRVPSRGSRTAFALRPWSLAAQAPAAPQPWRSRGRRGARRLGTDAWPAARRHSARLSGPAPARTRGPPAGPVPLSAVLQGAVRRRRVLQNKRLPYPSRAVAKARSSLSSASAAAMAPTSARPAFLVMTALALLLLLCVGPGKGAISRR